MYIDLFFIFNFIIDFIITLSVSIILKRKSSYIRMILSSLLGGFSSLLLFTSLNKILIEIISIILMVVISFGYKGIRYVIKNILYMYILSTLLGGIIYTIGAVLYGVGKKYKYIHSIFHLCVFLGNMLHVLCVLMYVI